MLNFYLIQPTLLKSDDNANLSALLDDLTKKFEISYSKVNIIPHLVKGQLTTISKNQGL